MRPYLYRGCFLSFLFVFPHAQTKLSPSSVATRSELIPSRLSLFLTFFAVFRARFDTNRQYGVISFIDALGAVAFHSINHSHRYGDFQLMLPVRCKP